LVSIGTSEKGHGLESKFRLLRSNKHAGPRHKTLVITNPAAAATCFDFTKQAITRPNEKILKIECYTDMYNFPLHFLIRPDDGLLCEVETCSCYPICNNKCRVPTYVIIACSTITTRMSHCKVRLLVNLLAPE